ncbi:hypothetical protein HDE_04642 [Halotydeus destructor]|nr:hypothetical protein HDE_04642 [Halotydeus destructor]
MRVSSCVLLVGLIAATSGDSADDAFKKFCKAPIPAEEDKMQSCLYKNLKEPIGGIMKACVIAAGQAAMSAQAMKTIMCNEPAMKKYEECTQSKLKAAKATDGDVLKAQEAAEQACKKS